MKITIISGSHRKAAQSMKVAKCVEGMINENKLYETAEIFSLSENPLPLWDQGVWEGDENWKKLLTPIKESMSSSDGFVIITPEWHGQVPAGLKNFFLFMSKNEMGHKPALIISVSSGDGGTYPISELRMSSYKNNRLCYIPEHVIIRQVEGILNDNAEDNDPRSDSYYRERILWSLNILIEYAKAFVQIRESGVTLTDKFNNGM